MDSRGGSIEGVRKPDFDGMVEWRVVVVEEEVVKEVEDEVIPFLIPFIVVDPFVCNFGPRRLILLFILWFGLFIFIIFILNDVTVEINIIDDKIENFIINICYFKLKILRIIEN